MNLTRDRVRSIGWAFVLTVCFALTMGLTFRVNAEKSEVRLAERQIVAVKQQKLFLETEFLTRANQQQLRNLNEVEFGYQAPTSRQYIEGERQLASLGKPRGINAPSPIRVASAADVTQPTGIQALVSPLAGRAVAAEVPVKKKATAGAADKIARNEDLRDRLARLDTQEARTE
jgi:hypothetical protein